MKAVIFALTLALTYNYGYAQELICTQDDAPKTSYNGTMNLGENGFVIWCYGNGTSKKGLKNKAQYIKDDEVQWTFELETDYSWFYTENMMAAAPDGKNTYFLAKSQKQKSSKYKMLMFQISESGDIDERTVLFPRSVKNFEALFCDNEYLYFYCSSSASKTSSAKDYYENFEPRIVKYNHATGDIQEVTVALDKVAHKTNASHWSLRDIAEEKLYFTRTELYKDQIVLWQQTIDISGKMVASSETRIPVEKLTKRSMKLDYLWDNTHPGITLNSYATKIDNPVAELVDIALDTKNNSLYLFHNSSNNSFNVHLLDLEGNKIKTLKDIPIEPHNAGTFSRVYIDHKLEGGLYLFADKGILHTINSKGALSQSRVSINKVVKINLPLRSYIKPSKARKYIEENKKTVAPPSLLEMKVHLFYSQGHEYLYYYNKKTKAAELLKF